MGRFVNPGDSAFGDVLNSKIYVDKSGLLEYTNNVLDTTEKFICNSRPRRFGKTMAADMLAAYYCKACNSEKMFALLAIGKSEDFKKYLNRYDVIHFDVQWCMMDAGRPEETVSYLNRQIIAELKEAYPAVLSEEEKTAYGAMSRINAATGKKFIVIIDEWDVLIRDEATKQEVQEEYINFLRGMFKGNLPANFISLAYLTGILPIKKIRTQSALNNFEEFTMLDAGVLAPYVGFTETEVKSLCTQYGREFEKVKRWYDGYELEDEQVYNPKAVVSVMTRGKYKSYWSETGTYESIVPLINMDFDGLKAAIIEMLSGGYVKVNVNSFQNDMVSFASKDDVLTYLIHLGYLGYRESDKTAFVPNEEIRQELTAATQRTKWKEMVSFWQESEELLEATLNQDAKTVSAQIDKIHMEYASAISYNNENSLAGVLSIAYLSAMEYYFKPIRELPTGRGFADFVFLPKPEYRRDYPALLAELKWNQNADSALAQIKEKRYPDSLTGYTDRILLVGINYDKKSKKHSCVLEWA